MLRNAGKHGGNLDSSRLQENDVAIGIARLNDGQLPLKLGSEKTVREL